MAKVVVITGASAGVGRSAARLFARRGYAVGLIARGADGLEATRAELAALGAPAASFAADVADHDQVEAAASSLERSLGPIEVWVNDAMVTAYAPFESLSPAEFRRITEVVYLGQVHGTMAALRRMRPRNRGTIVQVGSGLGYRSIPFQSAYCGAKFATRGFTDSLRSELIRSGSRVRLSMVQLPGINTPQFEWGLNRLPNRPRPAPPVYSPRLAARAILRAAETAPRELWVGTPTLKLVLGQWAAPAYLDRMLASAAYDGQQTDLPDPGNRPHNLFEPLPGDWGARGRFDGEAHDSGIVVDPHRLRQLGLGVGVAALAAALTAAGIRLLGGRPAGPRGRPQRATRP